MSLEAKDLISKMLTKNPAVRLTASEVLQHPWSTGHVMSELQSPANVLEMMRLWRSEMKVTSSDDWLAATNVLSSRKPAAHLPKTSSPPISLVSAVSEHTQTTPYLQIPKTNIEFDRNAHKRCKTKDNNDSGSYHTQDKGFPCMEQKTKEGTIESV